MANASVDKLKALGLRHGEKAVVGIAAALFVAFAALGIMTPVLDMKPEQLSSQASQADVNLKKPQDDKDVLAKIEEAGIKDPGFVKLVENQVANALKADDYRVRQEWVIPEPGAGLIRDQPEMIAPTDILAFPGRGGLSLFVLNEKGERIPDAGPDAKVAKGGRNRGGGPRGMVGPGAEGPGGGPAGRGGNSEEAKKRDAAEEEKRKRALAGNAAPAPKKEGEAKAEEAPPAPVGPFKEKTEGKRWVVVTAVIDHEQMRKNWLAALKNPAIAYPAYVKADVERQVRVDDAWGEWAPVDSDKNFAVLDNLTEGDTEFVPESKRPVALVDPLPFLKAGYWSGVHVARLVPPDAEKTAGGEGPGGRAGVGGGGTSLMSGPAGGGPGRSGGGGGGNMAMGDEGPGVGSGARSGGGRSGGGAAPDTSGGPEVAFEVNNEDALMIRSIDFTVEPNTSYRYRVRIVCLNPNKDHSDVNPGVDTESKELIGPWSAVSTEATVPADVSAYAEAAQPTERRNDQVVFQVIRWNPGTGQTVINNDVAVPGQIVGEFGSVQEPSSNGGGAKTVSIDFNSRSIVLDTMGGREPREKMPDIGVEKNPNITPVIALLMQPDGSVVIRSEARDKGDEVREDMDSGYHQALKDSGTKRQSGSGGSRAPGGQRGKKGKGSRKGGGRR